MKDSMDLLAGPFFAGDTLPFVSFGSLFGIDETNSFTLGEEAPLGDCFRRFCDFAALPFAAPDDLGRFRSVVIDPGATVPLLFDFVTAAVGPFGVALAPRAAGFFSKGSVGPTPKPSLEVPGEPTRTMRFSSARKRASSTHGASAPRDEEDRPAKRVAEGGFSLAMGTTAYCTRVREGRAGWRHPT